MLLGIEGNDQPQGRCVLITRCIDDLKVRNWVMVIVIMRSECLVSSPEPHGQVEVIVKVRVKFEVKVKYQS